MWLQLSIRIWGLSALNKIIFSLNMQLMSIFMTKFLIEKKIIKMTTESNAVVILSTYDFYNFIFFSVMKWVEHILLCHKKHP